MDHINSEEDLLERVLYAYEKDEDPKKSMYRFQYDAYGGGPTIHCQAYKLVPTPTYRHGPKCCCSIRTAVCVLLLIIIFAAIVGLGAFYVTGYPGIFGHGIAETDGLLSNNLTNMTLPGGLNDETALQSSTTDHFDLMKPVMHPGERLVIRPADLGQVPPTAQPEPVIVLEYMPEAVNTRDCHNSSCHRLAYCNNGSCMCGNSFQGDGTTFCVPIISVHQCQPGRKGKTACCCNSHCVLSDTLGIFACACKEGYERKGGRCVDVNECSPDKSMCPTDSTCYNVSGGFRCLCSDQDAVYDGIECRSRKAVVKS